MKNKLNKIITDDIKSAMQDMIRDHHDDYLDDDDYPFDDKQSVEILAPLLQKINDADLEMFNLHYFDGFSFLEIAKMKDISKRRVELAINRVKKIAKELNFPAPKRQNLDKVQRKLIFLPGNDIARCTDAKNKIYIKDHNDQKFH